MEYWYPWPEIINAAMEGSLEDVMRLVDEDPEVVNAIDEDDTTSLHLTSFKGHVEVVSYLMDHGANINAKDDIDSTPLFNACNGGRSEVLELLVSRGADPTIYSLNRLTPLMTGNAQGHADVVRYLLMDKTVKAAIDAQDGHGWTALHHASTNGAMELMKVLIGLGANSVVIADREGLTPLEMTKKHGLRIDCIPILDVSPSP